MKAKPHLLLVDDDRASMRYYVLVLEEAGYSVTQRRSVSDGIEYVKAYSPTIDGVILDLMLPLGCEAYSKESEFGLHGGLIVFRYLQAEHPGIPILVLSNTRSGEVLSAFTKSDSVQVEAKMNLIPSEIVSVMQRLVGSTRGSDGEAHP